MLPDDPRHGRRAGYIAGCRDECCRNPHIRYQKRSRLRYLREGTQYVDREPILERLAWWAAHGVTARAVAMGSGTVSESTLQGILRDGYRPEKATTAATLAVTWDDLPDTALVNADLTRARIYSLMAAGHPLWWICEQVRNLNVGGKWRDQEKVTLGLARDVQRLYDTAPYWGLSKQTASKARARGHQPPAGWDDPGTPAEVAGWSPALLRDNRPARTDVDEAVVLRVMAGERLPMTTGERVEVVARLRARGWSLNEITMHTGIGKAERYAAKGDAA